MQTWLEIRNVKLFENNKSAQKSNSEVILFKRGLAQIREK